MENLPQNWVIDTQVEKDSPLMPKFMEWIEKNKTIGVGNKRHIGYWHNDISDWSNESLFIPIITLEQWNAFYFPEWEPKQGERVFVSNFSNDIGAYERVFVVKHNETYYCEDISNVTDLVAWKYIKPLPKESILQPLVDQLKSEAKKLGIEKVNITFE